MSDTFPVSEGEAFAYFIDVKNRPEYWSDFFCIFPEARYRTSHIATVAIKLLNRERALNVGMNLRASASILARLPALDHVGTRLEVSARDSAMRSPGMFTLPISRVAVHRLGRPRCQD